jgi:type I restriction enzyme M protein
MFEQTFKNIDDILHKDAGCSSELDYVEQTSWILFLKYLDDLEKDKKTAAELSGKTHTNIIAPEYQWIKWAAPKGKDGKIDHHLILSGDDLSDFVNNKLFPYLKQFKNNAENPDTIEYKIGEIFSEIKNRVQSGYNLREIINRIDELKFRTHAEKHEMSHLYEDKIKNMGNAGRNGGEYYTPRPLIRTIIKVINPKIGETIYDAAAGSAGFLCEAFDYLINSKKISTTEFAILQKKTFYGKEKKSLAYILGTMNMILHGVEAPNILHTNTLSENLSEIREKNRHDIVLANPPFGGKERAEVQQNFPIKTGETASLFLQHFIKILKAGGRAGIVIKNTFLNNPDNATVSLRKQLIESCNLHTILILPSGTFSGAQGVKTVVLFFEKGISTKKIWYYQLNLGRNLGKTNPLNEKDLNDFVELQKNKADSINSWTIDVKNLDPNLIDLFVKNPKTIKKEIIRDPEFIQDEFRKTEIESQKIFNNISKDLKNVFNNIDTTFPKQKIKDICLVIAGQSPEGKYYNDKGVGLPFYQGKKEFTNKFIGEPKIWTSKVTKEAIKGDILMSVRAPVGPVNFATEKCCIGRGLAAIRAGKKVDQNYLYYYFLKHENEIVGKEGIGFNSINKNQIECLEVSLPPMKIQLQIVKTLDKLFLDIENLNTLQDKKVNNINELRKSVMKIAFKI